MEPMRAFALPIAAAALLALAGVLVVTALQRSAPMSRDAQVHQIASELRCPDCEGLSVADSSTQAAVEIRRQIGVQLGQGRAPDEVRQSFVDRYGDWIVLSPAAPIAWVLPLIVVAAGAAGLAVWLWNGRRRTPEPLSRRAVTDAERAAAREEAEALDA